MFSTQRSARPLGAAALALGLMLGVTSAASAGPVIIDGTDANDHGFASGGVNEDGWAYMEAALENIASQVSASVTKVVVNLGADIGTQSGNAIASAFNLSSLAGSGWTLQNVTGAAAVSAWLAGLSTANTGILALSTAGNSGGDLDGAELAAVNANSTNINNFVGGAGDPTTGGGLFAMGESGPGAYGWLTTLIPGIVPTDLGGGGISSNVTLTAAGQAAFPGLSNAELAGAQPWHGYFSGNLGGLSVLGTAPEGGQTRNVILGGGAGTVIGCGQPGQPACPTPVPEPASLSLLGTGLAGLLWQIRRRSSRA